MSTDPSPAAQMLLCRSTFRWTDLSVQFPSSSGIFSTKTLAFVHSIVTVLTGAILDFDANQHAAAFILKGAILDVFVISCPP